MKKIYMILAAITLLSLSLNAQDLKVDQFGNVVQPKAQTGKVNAPNRANRTTVTVVSDDFSSSSGWTILDVNNDGSTWKISSGYATYSYNQSNAANDWLVYSAIALEAGKTYTFNLDAWRRSATWTEKLEVKFATGSTASALSAGTTIITETTISSTSQTSPDALSNTFTVPTSGNYYIGIHATSARNQYDMYVDNMVITTESSDPIINASTNAVSFTATPNETVSKTITVNGENLTGDITATISGTDASLFSVSPATTSGGTLTITYSPTAVGSHTATLTLSSTGAQDVTVAFTGTCTNDITICDGNTTNNYLPLYGWYYDDVQINQMIYPSSLLTNLNGKKITSMTFYSPNLYFSGGKFTVKVGETSQASFSSAVRNTADLTATVVTDMVAPTAGGTELTITFAAPFEYHGGNLLVDFEVTQTGSYGSSQTSFYGVTQSGGGFNSYSSSGSSPNSNGVYDNATVRDFLPKVTFATIVDTTPKIEVSPESLTINDSGTNNTFTVQGSNLGSDNVGVTVPDGSGFTRTTNDQYWGFVNNNGSVSGTATIGYEGRDLSASTTVSVGNNLVSTTVAVTYRADLYIVGDFGNGWDFSTGTPMTYNSGDNTYTATVTVDANNLILFARKLGESNPWNTRLVFGPNSDGDWWVTGDNANGTIDLYDDDPIKIVNSGTYTVTINATTGALTIEKLVLPPPENVEAVADSENQSATVTWDAPSNLPMHIAQVTEDFENTSVFPPFSTGGIDATTHTGAFGEWTLYDATGGCIVYGSKQLDYDNEGAPHAWFVFAPSGATASSDYPNAVPHDSYSGAQYLESICPQSSTTAAGVSDHWLISPELSGNAQTISFYVCEMTTQYGDETYEIWVSDTDNDPSSFTQLGNYYSVSSTDWEERLVQLPAGTKYFAIRHTSPDIFGLLIDDLSYETNVPVIEPVSYNVYLNGVLVGNVPANDPLTYDFSNLAGGNYTVEISAVYPGDIESEKVADTFTIVGKTAAPTISVTPGAAEYTITATAADPDATVTLTVDGVEYTGTGSVSVTVDRGTTDKNVDVSATAQKGDLLESDPATQIVTVPALPITPTPTITYDTTNATVVVTATGDGTVYLEVDGQVASGEGSVSITIMRSIEDRTVTATATAVDDNHQPSAEASREVPVPALNGTPSTVPEGLLRMHLLVVDQLKEEIPDDNSHPDRYGYVLKWEQPANADDRKQSGTVEVDIQKTEAQVNGYYTLDQIDADVNIGINHDQGLTMDVLTADVGMFLPGENPDVLYYQMQGKQGEDPELNEDYLTQLQYMKNVQKYEEMLATSPNKTHQYPANETYHYYDDSTPIVTGIYNDPTSFITYAPSVSTWGIQRRYFEDDGLDNTYGAPIWKTAVGKVELKSAVHERQKNSWNSVNWTDAGGNACSLYILKDIVAEGYLPHTGISNVEYEPYMFRVFVESKNGKLRPYTVVPQGDGDYDGEHLVAGEGTTTGPLCVWSGYCMDGDVNGMTFSEGPSETVSGQTKYTFTKEKVDRDDISNPWLDYDTIKDPETGEVIDIVLVNDRNAANAMFGALDNLAEIIGTDDQGKPIYATVTEDDLKVFVRFYYVAAGTADGHTRNTRAGGASYPAGYGTESPGKAPSPWTSVNELQYHGEIVSQTYVNVQGMQSDEPFDGVNIVVTRYSDGTTSTTKVIYK